ncbi:MAG: bacillithiol biosynthesis deacetylase BshB1 [Candidatus Zixiibacteriota bacterium]
MTKNDSRYDILAVGAHPDDVEVGCAGVIADCTHRGYRSGLVVLTQGEMGTGGTSEIRSGEIREAARIMGAEVLATFDWGDTRLEDSYDKRQALAEVIRRAQPKVILCPWPHVGHGRNQSHPDHVATGVIAVNAAHLASLKKADVTGEPHMVTRIFHYFLPPGVNPDFVVDITPWFDTYIAALSAHRSQFLNPEKKLDYIELLTARARSYGLMIGCKYGQGFKSAEMIRVLDIMNLAQTRG